MSAPGAHRLVLSAREYRLLVDWAELGMPPGWEPGAPSEDGESAGGGADAQYEAMLDGLFERGVLVDADDELDLHPSVLMNLVVLAEPQLMVETTASIGAVGASSLHAVAGELGASLFALRQGGVELSMFASVTLGRELIRAVPEERVSGISAALGGAPGEPPRGWVPLDALHELGVAELMRGSDPWAPAEVRGMLGLPAEQLELVARVSRSDGGLRSVVTGIRAGEAVSGLVVWLHLSSGWLGLMPDPDGSGRRMVRLEPAGREDLGTWVAPMVAAVLS
jgi:hypothetical protein